jgi:perosamine synthetase
MALDIGPGDEVIIPDFTMIASPNAVRLAGATPVMVDISRKTLCIDIAAAEAAITPRTKAIMPVLLNGRHPDMGTLKVLARKHGLSLVEDAAQALGSRSTGKHLGVFGEIGSFSFSTPKIITTGQGGMLVTHDAGLYEKMMKLKDFGRRQKGEDIHIMMGYNFKFTEFQAAVGMAQMRKLDWRVQRKKDMFRLYRVLLDGIPRVTFMETDLDDTSPWFVDVLVEGEARDALMEHLKERGIGTRPFYPPIHAQAPYAHIKGHFPICDSVCGQGLWLPSSSFLSDDDIARVCDEIKCFFR